MKKTKIAFVFISLLVALIGCAKKEDLPYALSAEQYRIIYVVSEQENKEQLQWFQEFQNDHKGVNLIAFDLELTQNEYPSLEANEAPYIYILDRKNIVFKGSGFEEAKIYLIDNTK